MRQVGLSALSPSTWVDGDALGTANDLFERLRDPQTPEDRFTTVIDAAHEGRALIETERLLAQEGPWRFFVAESARGEVCFTVALGDGGGSTCQLPVVVATQGVELAYSSSDDAVSAEFASDDLDTSTWAARALRQLSPNVWVEGPPSQNRLELADGATAFIGNAYSGDVPAVLLHGRVVLLDGGCLGFGGYDGTDVLVLQHGTTVSADGLGLVTPGGVEVRVGDWVQGGSGDGGVAGTGLQEEWEASFPECFAGRDLAAIDLTALSPPT